MTVKEAVGADLKRSRADGTGERRRVSSLLRRRQGGLPGGVRRDRDSIPLPRSLQDGYCTRVGVY